MAARATLIVLCNLHMLNLIDQSISTSRLNLVRSDAYLLDIALQWTNSMQIVVYLTSIAWPVHAKTNSLLAYIFCDSRSVRVRERGVGVGGGGFGWVEP